MNFRIVHFHSECLSCLLFCKLQFSCVTHKLTKKIQQMQIFRKFIMYRTIYLLFHSCNHKNHYDNFQNKRVNVKRATRWLFKLEDGWIRVNFYYTQMNERKNFKIFIIFANYPKSTQICSLPRFALFNIIRLSQPLAWSHYALFDVASLRLINELANDERWW